MRLLATTLRPFSTTASTASRGHHADVADTFWDSFLSGLYFGFNAFTLGFLLTTILILLHVSMIVFIWRSGRDDKTFRQAFYVQFAAVTVADCIRMTLTQLVALRHVLRNPPSTDFYDSFYMAVVALPVYAQSMLHTLIAVNRFTALFFPFKHDILWSTWRTALTLAAVFLLAPVLNFVPLYGPAWISGNTTDTSFYGIELSDAVNAVFCFASAIAGFVLSVSAVIKLKIAGNEVYSTFMVLLQALTTASTFITASYMYILMNTAEDPSKPAKYATRLWFIVMKMMSEFIWKTALLEHFAKIYSLSGTLFLLFVSRQIRSAYTAFYFRRAAHASNVSTTYRQ